MIETGKERLTRLISSTFIGFILSVIVMYFKPELQASIVACYGIFAGKRAFEIHTTSPKKEKDKDSPT